MSSNCGKKPEYLLKTHLSKGRRCKLHTERLELASVFKPRTFLLLYTLNLQNNSQTCRHTNHGQAIENIHFKK